MKTYFKLMSAAFLLALTSCNNGTKVETGTYVGLNTGETVYIIVDPQTWWAIDSIKKVPVEFYPNNAGDTLFQSGSVVNNLNMKADGCSMKLRSNVMGMRSKINSWKR